jgi:hypothetical protein
MSSDQCALNPDGSLKDAKDIQWFNDPDDAQPLSLDPSTPAPSQPLGRGHRNKVTNRFLDAVARERLGSDEEADAFAKPPKRKNPVRASNTSNGAAPPTLSSGSSFGTLPEEVSSDGDEEKSFQSPSGSESGDKSSDESTDLELISSNEVCV